MLNLDSNWKSSEIKQIKMSIPHTLTTELELYYEKEIIINNGVYRILFIEESFNYDILHLEIVIGR